MKRLSCPCLAALLLAAAGCRHGADTTQTTTTAATAADLASADPIKAVPDKDRYKVVAATTGFFRYSPLQAAGSDADLKKNDRLTMLSRGRGFSQVKTADGQVGYVGTEDIAQLSPAEITQEDTATLQQAAAAAGGAALPMASPTPGASPTRNGKKASASSAGVTIPSDAGRNERLPEPDARPKPTATPLVNFR